MYLFSANFFFDGVKDPSSSEEASAIFSENGTDEPRNRTDQTDKISVKKINL